MWMKTKIRFTLFFRHGGPQTLHYALRATYWPGIAMIPANLGLYDAEYEFAARMARDSTFVLDRLRDGIDSIKDNFDVILLDPPPALGMISLSVSARSQCTVDTSATQ